VKPGAREIIFSGNFSDSHNSFSHTGLDISWRSGRRADLLQLGVGWGSSDQNIPFGYGKCDLASKHPFRSHQPCMDILRNFNPKLAHYIRKKNVWAKAERPRSGNLLQVNSICEKRRANRQWRKIDSSSGGTTLTLWNPETSFGSAMDPLLFGSEIKDRTPPLPQKIATTNFQIWTSRVNGNSAARTYTCSFGLVISYRERSNQPEKVALKIQERWINLDGASNRNGSHFELFGWLWNSIQASDRSSWFIFFSQQFLIVQRHQNRFSNFSTA